MNLKNNYLLLLPLATIVAITNSACYNHWKGDALPHVNSTYCTSVLLWPVSDLILNDTATRDSTAIAYYQEIYNNSYLTGAVDLDCLGVIQYMACALAYPTCDDHDSSIETVCTWLCNLMANRCGKDTSLYQHACVTGSTSATKCSYSSAIFCGLLAFLGLALLF